MKPTVEWTDLTRCRVITAVPSESAEGDVDRLSLGYPSVDCCPTGAAGLEPPESQPESLPAGTWGYVTAYTVSLSTTAFDQVVRREAGPTHEMRKASIHVYIPVYFREGLF